METIYDDLLNYIYYRYKYIAVLPDEKETSTEVADLGNTDILSLMYSTLTDGKIFFFPTTIVHSTT